jgi:hypothetical protein
MENMTTRATAVCKFGVEMPIETEEDGPISDALAQRIAADCANEAADQVFATATAALPPGLACESFKAAFNRVLDQAIRGSRVKTMCHAMTRPVKLGL